MQLGSASGIKGKIMFKTKCYIAAALLYGAASTGSAYAEAPISPAEAAKAMSQYSQSAEGGHVVGNPASATRIVEYVSYTCGHCGTFETEEAPLLKKEYVAQGNVSFEIRNLVRDPFDLTIAMLARCGGTNRFFANHNHFMATQDEWIARASMVSAATKAKAEAGDLVALVTGLYTDMGLNSFAAQTGISDEEAKICLSDQSALDKIIAMSEKATGPLGIDGTPAFLVNDKLAKNVHGLEALRKLLPE